MASKDKGGKSEKKEPKKNLKEKRQAKKAKLKHRPPASAGSERETLRMDGSGRDAGVLELGS